jgi:hypothetical protein
VKGISRWIEIKEGELEIKILKETLRKMEKG